MEHISLFIYLYPEIKQERMTFTYLSAVHTRMHIIKYLIFVKYLIADFQFHISNDQYTLSKSCNITKFHLNICFSIEEEESGSLLSFAQLRNLD